MENLFMQVFERRDWATAQMQQQVDSHDESLACTLLAAGHRPPPWLLPSFPDQPQELNGRPIVSELLFHGNQITTPATNRTVFQPPVVRGTSFRIVEVPNRDTCIETVCATLETNQHEEPEQKQTSDNQELAEASEVTMFSMVQRSRSRQRRIEDRLLEKNKAANSGSSNDMQRSRLAIEGSNKTNPLLASEPCRDGSKNASTTASFPGQEDGFHANQGRSTESLKCSNVKVPNNCSARNLEEVQVTDITRHPQPETHLLVEPKKLQFDGVESVCMNPAKQTTQQDGNTLANADPQLDESQPLNEDPSSTSHSKVPCSLGRSFLGGIQSEYLNPDSATVKQHPNIALECAILDLPGMHSRKEDPSVTCSSEVTNSMNGPLLENDTQFTSANNFMEGPCSNVSPPLEKEKINSIKTKCYERSCSPVSQLLEKDTLQTVEDTERTRILDGFSDGSAIWNPKPLVQRSSDFDVLHPTYSPPLQLSELPHTSSGAPSSSGILPERLIEEDGCEDLSHSLINGGNCQCVQVKSVYPEQLQPQTVTLADVCQPSVSCYEIQSDTTRPNGSPIVNTSVSAGNELSQDQYLSSGLSLQFDGNLVDAGTLLGYVAPSTENEKLNENSENDAVICHPGKLSDIQVKLSALSEACDITVRNEKDEYVVPEVLSSIGARRTSTMLTTKGDNITSAEKWTGKVQQNGTEQDTSLLENAVQINVNSCAAENDKPIKSSRPSVPYSLRSTSSHEKNSMVQSDGSRPTCDQKRSVDDRVQVNGGLSSKRRRISRQSDVSLSRTPCAESLSLSNQVGISGHMLTVTNFSEKSQPSGCNLTSSASCEIMSMESEGTDDARNHKTSMATDIYGNGNSSHGRRNTTSLSDFALHSSLNASSRRNAIEERVLENSQKQIQNNLEVGFLARTAALPSFSGILSDNETNCTQEEYTCLEGQDLNVNDLNVADEEMALQMDNMSSQNLTLNPENYSERDSFTTFSSYALAQHGEHASAPNSLVHVKLGHGPDAELGRKYKSYDPKRHLLSGAPISRKLGDDYVDRDDTMPEFESFDIPVQFDSPTIGQRTLEGLYDSRQLATFSSDPANFSFHGDLEQYRASIIDSLGEYGLGLDGSFLISDAIEPSSSNASNIQEINETPLTPSVEKYSLGKLLPRSGSSSDHMGSIPELECFRIDEGSSIAEEHEYQDRIPGSVDADYSPSGRKALQDITGLCQNDGNSLSLSTRCMVKCNNDLTSETFSSELNHHSSIRYGYGVSKPKVNHSTSVKREGKLFRSLHDRLSKTDLVDSRNGRHMSEANVDRRSKPSNIVANVTSFIPLVKQKLQPTTACGKKDVKVKALKVAEAAKRLEEKKQKDQEMRKAAAKVERERLKQEKELKQKLEDEQKKKREVDLATKKRQREEVEKREIARKRKCIDEARKQQKQPMDRRRTTKDEKDARRKASDNMEPGKNIVHVGKNQVKPESTTESALGCIAEKCNNEKGVPADEGHLSFGSHANENMLPILEESYNMSPYKDSDVEDDDDSEHEQESRRRKKFVPSWAQKENLGKILLSNMSLDPREIFAQKCSFNISDVLCAHIPQRGFR